MTGNNQRQSGDAQQWDAEYDVVVAGFGCAGACTAIEAADNGARVLVVDRFFGGGATKMSGGVIYAGGGSDVQRRAGFRDNPEKMYRYLSRETGTGVDERTLRAFCRSSIDNLAWLGTLGIAIPDKFFEKKTTQPPGGYGLYFSGNEKQYNPDDPIPRGHVPDGTGMSGNALFQALKKGVLERGVEVRYRCRAISLITENGAVIGIKVRALKKNILVGLIHTLLFNLGLASFLCRKLLQRFENMFSGVTRIRAMGGVILCSGGFVYNRAMVSEHAPAYAGCMPLGTPGDDGSAIVLGRDAGAAVESMDACAASRFFCPPEAFVSGLLVNSEGTRFCDESMYGATLSRHISKQPARRAYLIIDAKIHHKAGEQMKQEERLRDSSLIRILSGEMNALIFRKAMSFMNRRINRIKAASIPELEKKCGMPAGSLSGTIAKHNERTISGNKDEFGKSKQYMEAIDAPPFYAINCRLDSRLFPSPCLTLGGLKVNGLTSQALRDSGAAIKGLYAAGRSAAGVCSRSYVSGLSLADCIFSGRNAGKSASKASKQKKSSKKFHSLSGGKK
jgi:3-oxo-5alpha-steroid 4-dehydrogenase